jgi:hypothetical protein
VLVDLATAKLHLFVTDDAQDARVTDMLATAEEQAALFLGRNVYADQDALDAAKAAAPAVLSEASAAYDAACDAAWEMTVCAEREAYLRLAKDTYNAAFADWDRTMRGIVVTESIRTAILLITGSQWEHRGDEDAVVGVPPAAERFLWPLRTGLGV